MRRRSIVFAVVLLSALAGIGMGVGSYTFIYAKGFSYMSNDAIVCANCHIMTNHFDAWTKGSHHAVAVCNDCHTPPSLIPKYFVKGLNGFNHSLAFTTGHFHEPIQATAFNHRVAEANCRYCHADIVHQIDVGGGREPQDCIRCHRYVGHWE
ncbi:MAG: cytochrome c nitrite reductase small subunit [Candidatus Hydrogenedentales bacterium]|jgi:cytochrome c nitrite reductase small subunit